MRTLAIGDIHGCSHALDILLNLVQPQVEDHLITLGDYIDRGPDSRGVLDRLIELNRSHNLIPLLGNHEQMMLEARYDAGLRRGWLGCGGKEALASYAPPHMPGTLDHVPPSHWHFLERTCRDWHETATHLFVHASFYPELEMCDQPASALRWENIRKTSPHVSGKIAICGHQEQREGLPLHLGHAICIDTWAYGTGWLSCLDVERGFVWQARSSGETRTLWVDDVH